MPDCANRFVAHFDMLGMSHLTMRDLPTAWGALQELDAAKEDRINLRIEVVTGDVGNVSGRVTSYAFSDTILLFTESDTRADLWAIVMIANEIFFRSIFRSIPVRGAIAHGEFCVDRTRHLFAGPPLIDAYRLGEDQQWLGLSVDPVVAERANAEPIEVAPGWPLVIPWSVPLSDGYEQRAVVDWPLCFHGNLVVEPPITVDQFYKAFVPLFGELDALPDRDRKKHENTVEFYNARMALRERLPPRQ